MITHASQGLISYSFVRESLPCFQGFHHTDLFQFPVHYQVDQQGEYDREQCGQEIAEETDIPAEHHYINLRRPNHKSMEGDPQD